MPFRLQQIEEGSKFIQHLHLDLLEEIYPREQVSEILTRCHAWGKRERKLSPLIIVYYVIALCWFRDLGITAVFHRLAQSLRWLWPDPCIRLPGGAALTYRRQQLGSTPLRHLFRECCRPLADEKTKGAFAFGLRLMALDSTLDEVADTFANALHFGRLCSGKSASPFPQVRCLYLAEVGTHAIVDAVLTPARFSEQALAPVVERSLQAGMLVLADRNFASTAWLSQIRRTGAHVLARLSADRLRRPRKRLCDGTLLHSLSDGKGDCLQVRVIEYSLDPVTAAQLADLPSSRNSHPSKPGQLHRLVTTLLDPVVAPAYELICAYHERWEIELAIDEMKSHQRLSGRPLRSKEPQLVYQELYGLLLAHYAIRYWMVQAACLADLDPDRLSFTHSLQLLQTACSEFVLTAREQLASLRRRLLMDLSALASLLPARRLRFFPRVIKRAFPPFVRKQFFHQGFVLKGACFPDILLI